MKEKRNERRVVTNWAWETLASISHKISGDLKNQKKKKINHYKKKKESKETD